MEENFKNRFNFAAFIMPQFWSLGNHVWIGLLAFIPIVYPFMAFYLGFCGSRMAYEKSDYYSEEDFYEHQRKWNIAAVIYLIVLFIIFYFALREPLGNYIVNKHNINQAIDVGEEAEERLTDEITTIMDSPTIHKIIDGKLDTSEMVIDFSDDELWQLQNSHATNSYESLSRGRYTYENPKISLATIDCDISEQQNFSLVFIIDDNYELIRVKYVYRKGDTAHVTEELISHEEIQEILKK